MVRLSTALIALAALGASATVSSAGCVRAGGEATMVTVDLAKFMAEAALKNSISANNWKPQGQVQMSCDTNMGLPHCVARQKACS